MLVIKVLYREGEFFKRTYLFEANQPTYFSDAVKTYQEWCDTVKKFTEDYSIPCTYIMEYPKEEDFTGTTAFPFLVVFYDYPDDQLKVLFIRNAQIYVMSDGKTVDSISV